MNKSIYPKQQYFKRMTTEHKIQALQKMSKVANTRIDLLAKNDLKETNAFDFAQQVNAGDKKAHFYRGKNYKDDNAINEAYQKLTIFLDEKTSTLKGVKESVKEKAKRIIDNNTTWQDIKSHTSRKEKEYLNEILAKEANRRLKVLEQTHNTQYAYEIAKHFNSVQDFTPKKNFKQTGKNTKKLIKNRFLAKADTLTKENIRDNINAMLRFLRSASSTPAGIEKTVRKRLNTFREKGVNIKPKDEKLFFDFLSSKQFKKMGKLADSNQVLETFVDSLNEGEEVKTINREFEEFLKKNITIDVVQERLNVAKWKKGGLMK